jgi:hypothetical protein
MISARSVANFVTVFVTDHDGAKRTETVPSLGEENRPHLAMAFAPMTFAPEVAGCVMVLGGV